ncbi:hypothetical protein Sjap_007091 [Stephania japonica]|uniref:Guanine nucleotide-binding protein subunit beta-like protein n=1 Tax=Stephania japonica TaxID=461633 RepID=A0AAP0JM28_9MAGN
MAGTLILKGTMKSHTNVVTAIANPIDDADMIVSSYRDKSVIVWHLTKEEGTYDVGHRRLTGHYHFVQDVVLSSDGQFVLSNSWDAELCLWNINTGATTRRFVGHDKDVLSVAFSVAFSVDNDILFVFQNPSTEFLRALIIRLLCGA